MCRSNSASKLTIQKVNFLILHQLTHRCILMLCPWHCRSTSCHCKLSIGRHNRSCSRNAVRPITCKLYHSVPFEWKVIFEDTVYTNRSGTPSWTMSLLMCWRERILTTATKTHAVVWGIFNRRVFLFADCRRSNKSRNNWTTTSKRLTAVWAWAPGTVCWFLSTINIANFLVLTGSFQRLPFNLHV